MAQKSAKNLASRNSSRLQQTHLIAFGLNLLFLVLRFTLRGSLSLQRWLLFSAPAFVLEYYLDRLARPSYNADGTLRRAGEDLDAKGLTEFIWDVIYWTWLNLVAVIIFGNRAWWLYLAVPAYAIYAAVTTASGVKNMLGGMGAAGGEGEVQNTSNRQKKMEKRGGQRVAYSR